MKAEETKSLWLDLLIGLGSYILPNPVHATFMLEVAIKFIPAEIIPQDFVTIAALDFIDYFSHMDNRPEWLSDSAHNSCVKFIQDLRSFQTNEELKSHGGLN